MARWSRQMNENTAEMLSTSEKAICLKFRLVLSIHARALVGIFVWYREKVMVFLLCPLHYLIVTISFYFISYLLIFTPCLFNHFSFFLFCCFSIPTAVCYPTFLFISCKIKKKKVTENGKMILFDIILTFQMHFSLHSEYYFID